MTEKEATREEIMELLFYDEPTDPDALDWEPVLGIFKIQYDQE